MTISPFVASVEDLRDALHSNDLERGIRYAHDGEVLSTHDDICGDSKAAFAMPADRRIMSLIESGRGRIAISQAMPREQTGVEVLRAVALSGHGHWESLQAPALGRPLPCHRFLRSGRTQLHASLAWAPAGQWRAAREAIEVVVHFGFTRRYFSWKQETSEIKHRL